MVKYSLIFIIWLSICTTAYAGNTVQVRVSVTIPHRLQISQKSDSDSIKKPQKVERTAYVSTTEKIAREDQQLIIKTSVVR